MVAAGDAPITLPLDVERTCASCGGKVRLILPEGAPSWLVSIAERQVRGEMPAECERCTKAADDAERARQLSEARERLMERRLGASGIPRKWHRTTFDAPPAATLEQGELEPDDRVFMDWDKRRSEAIEAAREWGMGKRRGLLLQGPVGRGKTHLAGAAAMLRLEYGAVRWLSVAELLLNLRMPFDSKEYKRALQGLMAHERRVALVLDDLNKLKPTDNAVQPLYVAVNAWVESEQPLLVTMNGDLDTLAEDFGARFGEPIASRLAEHCKIVDVSGRDRRIEP